MAGGVKRRFQPQVCPYHDRNAYLEGRLSIRGITDGRCAEAISALRRTVLSHCCRTTAYWCSAQWDGRSAALADAHGRMAILKKAVGRVKRGARFPTFNLARGYRHRPHKAFIAITIVLDGVQHTRPADSLKYLSCYMLVAASGKIEGVTEEFSCLDP